MILLEDQEMERHLIAVIAVTVIVGNTTVEKRFNISFTKPLYDINWEIILQNVLQ